MFSQNTSSSVLHVAGYISYLISTPNCIESSLVTHGSDYRKIKYGLNNESYYEPIGVTTMNEIDGVVEFGWGARIYEICQLIYSAYTCEKVEIGMLMLSKTHIVDMVHEQVHQAAQEVNKQH